MGLALVARVAPSEPGVFMDPDLEKEFNLMKILGENTSLALPKARWYEGDRSILGAEFLVVDRAYGDVPADDPPYVVEGWVLDLEPGTRGALYDHAVEVVNTVQATDWQALGLHTLLDKPQYGATGLDQQIGYWEAVYGWASRDGRSSPTVEAALEWAKANRPEGESLTLNWGDARIGNIMYNVKELGVEAVLDWEMATIASSEMELGWLILLVAYYEAFAALRMSILMVRAGNMLIEAGAFPPDHPMPVPTLRARFSPHCSISLHPKVIRLATSNPVDGRRSGRRPCTRNPLNQAQVMDAIVQGDRSARCRPRWPR